MQRRNKVTHEVKQSKTYNQPLIVVFNHLTTDH